LPRAQAGRRLGRRHGGALPGDHGTDAAAGRCQEPPRFTTALFEQLRAAIPNATAELLPGLDHLAPEKAPEVVASALARRVGTALVHDAERDDTVLADARLRASGTIR
jgi:hypothetical protein